MTIPALRKLRGSFPDASISLFTRPWAEGVFRDADFIDEIILLQKSVFAQARELRKHAFDLAVILPNSFGSALAAKLAGIPRRLGYATQQRSFLLTDRVLVPAWKNEAHESLYYLNLIEQLADGNETPDTALPVSDERRNSVRRELADAGVREGRLLIGIGAGSTNSRAKRWPAANFAVLADMLGSTFDSEILLLGAEHEIDISAQVAHAATSSPVDLTGRTDLATATAILSELDLFISNDMGLAHIAAAAGTPTIVIFGPTNDVTTRPLGSNVVIVREPVECSPCMLRDCPIDHRCMTRISPERVFETAVKMLETRHQ